jgi:hypothetical protein
VVKYGAPDSAAFGILRLAVLNCHLDDVIGAAVGAEDVGALITSSNE